jgi:HK97 family phage portal protein
MFNWLTSRFPRRPADRPRTSAPHLEAVAAHNQVLSPDLSLIDSQARVYQQSPWVYLAVSRIAEAAALVPLRVYRRAGERQIEIDQHPLNTLLDAPNPTLTRFELFEQTIGMVELTGNAYWFLVGDGRGLPVEIWPLRPDRVTIVPDPVHHVRGYVYEIDGQRIPLEAVEVVHFKRWHPGSDYYGLSPMEAARTAIVSDRAMAEWNRNTFGKDNGVPAGIVNIKEFVTDADFERIKREWRASYGGPQRRTAFLRGGSVEWKHIGLSHTDLDFLQGRRAHRDEILNLFGIPIGLVSDNATEANAKVAERTFIERTLWPKLVRLAARITQDVIPFWPGDYTATFDDIRPTDTQARLDDIRAAYPILSVNEIRERYYHLPPVTWGDLPAQRNNRPALEGTSPMPGETAAAPPDPAEPSESAAKSLPDSQPDPAAELDRWERYVIKRWGRANARPFEVRAVPDELAFEISAGLLAAEDDSAAREVFREARDRLAES